MTIYEVILLSVGLAADAFAVSLCKGSARDRALKGKNAKKALLRGAVICGIWFGVFQAGMAALGYFVGDYLSKIKFLEQTAAWIACLLLVIIGVKMAFSFLFEGENEKPKKEETGKLSFLIMLPLAFATSIDACICGISIRLANGAILLASVLIGTITLVLSGIGYALGKSAGAKFGQAAEIVGGIILILIGIFAVLQSYITI